MSAGSEQRKLAAIMFTDMVGYSALSQRDDKLALELLEEDCRSKSCFPWLEVTFAPSSLLVTDHHLHTHTRASIFDSGCGMIDSEP
jgi:hypothetical protein